MVFKVGKFSARDYILTVQEKQTAHRGNRKNRSPGMTPWEMNLEAHQLNTSNMRMKRRIEKQKELSSYISGKICWKY